jgi:hypothetical protein
VCAPNWAVFVQEAVRNRDAAPAPGVASLRLFDSGGSAALNSGLNNGCQTCHECKLPRPSGGGRGAEDEGPRLCCRHPSAGTCGVRCVRPENVRRQRRMLFFKFNAAAAAIRTTGPISGQIGVLCCCGLFIYGVFMFRRNLLL